MQIYYRYLGLYLGRVSNKQILPLCLGFCERNYLVAVSYFASDLVGGLLFFLQGGGRSAPREPIYGGVNLLWRVTYSDRREDGGIICYNVE